MPKDSIYTSGEYLEHYPTWHEEDSEWKAEKFVAIVHKNKLQVDSVCEVGCGAGEVLCQMASNLPAVSNLDGYDISPQAIEMAKPKETDRIRFHLQDHASIEDNSYDLLVLADVLEHVPNYIEFVQECAAKAKYKVYHIPLDIHVSSVLRRTVGSARHSGGHLHYFTADTALDALRASGQRIVDHCYTDGAIALYSKHPSAKTRLANTMRSVLAALSESLAARTLGGYSLLVLTE
jgi:hypothetical protein